MYIKGQLALNQGYEVNCKSYEYLHISLEFNLSLQHYASRLG